MLPDIQQFIAALATIAETGTTEMRTQARAVLRDLGHPEANITEYMTPVICHPAHMLTDFERAWRRLALSKHIRR